MLCWQFVLPMKHSGVGSVPYTPASQYECSGFRPKSNHKISLQSLTSQVKWEKMTIQENQWSTRGGIPCFRHSTCNYNNYLWSGVRVRMFWGCPRVCSDQAANQQVPGGRCTATWQNELHLHSSKRSIVSF